MKYYYATENPNVIGLADDDGESMRISPADVEAWAEYEAWLAAGNTLLPAAPSKWHVLMKGEWYLPVPDDARQVLQKRNRTACREHILRHYPTEIQLSMNAGIYTADEIASYKDFVAACIAEENRVYNLLVAADDPTAIEVPIWPTPGGE